MLVCAECDRRSDERADGWRAYLAIDDDSGDEVVCFCQQCAQREFGAIDPTFPAT